MEYSKTAVAKYSLPVKELLPDVFAFPPNPDSFGGVSYLVDSGGGTFMVDVPEYLGPNLDFIEEKGAPEFIFLTHRDDVADAEMFREKFGSKLVIHESEEYAVKRPDIRFGDSLEMGEARILHTPGHSPGSSCLYYEKGRALFTGDHVVTRNGKLAVENFYWTYDYRKQIESARRLLDLDFEFILCGHGGRRVIRDAKHELRSFLENHG